MLIIAIAQASAQTETVLYSFTGASDGANPNGNLVRDSAGNLYGTATDGGSLAGACSSTFGCGTVYELSPVSGGGWMQTVLYTFTGGADGALPSAGLVRDASGNLFGTTLSGGVNHQYCGALSVTGCGVVFELSPQAGGHWTESVLYSFLGGTDGFESRAPLTLDSAGSLYGVTVNGGVTTCDPPYGCGEVYQVSPNGSGGWQYSVIHAFTGGRDGAWPSSLTVDSLGNVFVPTTAGGNTSDCTTEEVVHGCGTVAEFSPNGAGRWTGRLLHTFTDGIDGAVPTALILDSVGNVFGTTFYGGSSHGLCRNTGFFSGCGVVFELSPSSSGQYQYQIIHTFLDGADNAGPNGPLTLDAAGNLFGTGVSGGQGYGFAYELSPGASGWSETTLYNFNLGTGGWSPDGVVLDSSGNIYGANFVGGIAGDCSANNGCGVIYEITP